MNKKTILLYFFIVALLSSLDNGVKSESALKSDAMPSKRVTIFIHGTRLLRFFPFNFSAHLKGFDAFLATPYRGLQLYDSVSTSNNLVKIAKLLHQTDPTMFPLNTFYFYGWSGKLNISERRNAARKLASDIQTVIIDPYKEKYGFTPTITIITHSHGGNVALNLARQKNISFAIENLIMLACPVQAETMKFINNPLFKTVYSFYSHNDTLQILDPQLIGSINHGLIKAFIKKSTNPLKKLWKKLQWPFFSSRTFYTSPSLYQINVAWRNHPQWSDLDFNVYGPLQYLGKKMAFLNNYNQRGLSHIEFLIPTFIKQIPAIIKKAQLLKKDFTYYL